MNVAYPYGFDRRGRTRQAGADEHLRHLIEQVLFTAPGERVMRPTFGSGVNALVFAPGGDTVASAVQSLVQAALQQWLGDRARVLSVVSSSEEGTLRVEVTYAHLASEDARTVVFERAP